MALLVATRPVVGPGPHIVAVGRSRTLRMRCTAIAQSREPEREALSRRTLLGAGLALGESLPACSGRKGAQWNLRSMPGSMQVPLRGPTAACRPPAAAGLAALTQPRRALAAEGDTAPSAPAAAPADSSTAVPGGAQEGAGTGAPGAEGAADASSVPLSQEELERQAAAKLLEVRAMGACSRKMPLALRP